MQSLKYYYLAGDTEPIPGERSIMIAVSDEKFPPTTLQLVIEVVIINNNAPELMFAGVNSVNYPEGNGTLAVGALMQPSITDDDNNNIFLMDRAAVTLLNPIDENQESLNISRSIEGITAQG